MRSDHFSSREEKEKRKRIGRKKSHIGNHLRAKFSTDRVFIATTMFSRVGLERRMIRELISCKSHARDRLALGLILGQIDPNCFPVDNYSAEDSSSGVQSARRITRERCVYENEMREDTQGR